MSGSPSVSPSDFSLLCDVIRQVARRGRLPADEADDFSQHVHLRLLERNYAPLAMFAGQSSLSTYLTVVVKRQLLDWRNARFGKWRPLALAQRLGPVAVELDRLLTRDGHDLDQAIAIVRARSVAMGTADLRAIAAQLPGRHKVRMVGTDDLEPLSVCGFHDPIEAEQTTALNRQMLRALRRACRSLPPAERRLLYLRFAKRMSVAAIADVLGEPPKPLYRQLERILKSLRRTLHETALQPPGALPQPHVAGGKSTAVH